MCTGRIVNGMNVVDKMEEGTANREDGALPMVWKKSCEKKSWICKKA